jgi:hypothetical protein
VLSLIETILAPLWVWLGTGERPGALALAGAAVILGADRERMDRPAARAWRHNIIRRNEAVCCSARHRRVLGHSIVPALVEYVRIPAKSPRFMRIGKNGHIDAAVELASSWCRRNPLPAMKLEVVRLPGRTPVLLVEVPGEGKARRSCTGTSTSSRR